MAGLRSGIARSSAMGRPARRDLLLPADPVHPTADGAGLIAGALLPAVEQALKKLNDPVAGAVARR